MKLTLNMEGQQRELGLVMTAMAYAHLDEIEAEDYCAQYDIPSPNRRLLHELFNVYLESIAVSHAWTLGGLVEELRRRVSGRAYVRHAMRLDIAYRENQKLTPSQIVAGLGAVRGGPDIFVNIAVNLRKETLQR